MNHLSEADLALHYYGDADDAAAVERHLADCAQCRREFEQLKSVLAAVTMPVPEREANYEAQVWHNLRPQLGASDADGVRRAAGTLRPASASRWSWLAMPQRWAAIGALATLVIAAFLLGRWSRTPSIDGGGGSVQTVADKSARDRVLLVAVGDHLDRSQLILVELVNTRPGHSVDISAQQAVARQLLDDNRLYRQTAAQVQDRGVADVLDELERLLVDLSHRPSTVSAGEFEDIRHRIEAQGILFKVRVIGSEVRDRERETRAQPGSSSKAKS